MGPVDALAQASGPARPAARVRVSWDRAEGFAALVAFAVLCMVVLSVASRLVEPDDYAYRASIVAITQGHFLTLSTAQADRLAAQLAGPGGGPVADGPGGNGPVARGPGGSGLAVGGPGGIPQWVQLPGGRWISEKDPGYPFLAAPFQALGIIRLAPLFYGALGCLGLFFGARRWLGRYGGAAAVVLFCSSGAALLFAWRDYMPTFTDAALIAAGTGDGQPVFGGCAGLEPSGDLLDRFPWPEIAFREIGEGNPQVTGVTQDVVLAVAQDFQQAPSGVLPGAAPGAGPAGDLGQADPDRAPQVQGVLVQDRGGDVTGAAGAGGVRGVVQREQRPAGLGRPVRVRVVPGGTVKVSDQVRSAELMAGSGGGLAVIEVQAVVHDHRVMQVGADPGRLEGCSAPVAQVVGGVQGRGGGPHVLLRALTRK